MTEQNANNKPAIHVCLSPELISSYADSSSVVAVIDVLRATSSICTALHHGADRIIPVLNIEHARRMRAKGYMVGAERGGQVVEGFDFGNSPFSFMGEEIKGKTIVLTTSNGTVAILAAEHAYKVVIASFLNINPVCEWLANQNRDIVLLCAGWKHKFNMEDTLLAGAMVDRLLDLIGPTEMSDSSIAAKHLYNLGRDDIFGFLENSSHRIRLKKLKIEKDIEYCLTQNLTTVIPVLEGDSIVKMNTRG